MKAISIWIAYFFCQRKRFGCNPFLEAYMQTTDSLLLYICAGIQFILLLLLAIFCGGKEKFSTKLITTAALSLALAIVQSFIVIFRLPMGGSITLASLLPLLLFSYRYGCRYGIPLCFLFGVFQFLFQPTQIIHPAQFFLDYPLAFMSIGLAGLFYRKKHRTFFFILSAILALTMRYIAHLLSGVFAFGEFATGNPLLYSLAYNSFTFIDGGICIVIACILLQIQPLKKYLLPPV